MAQVISSSPLTFTVKRREPEIIVPAEPTPQELKPLSDIDDQQSLRWHISGVNIYRGDSKMGHENPASLIRMALSKLLVFYYPLAGRLKEGPSRKLMVDCSGQGVLFIEAEADVTFAQFGYPLHPPFPCMDQLLYDVLESSGILNAPLLLIQVTRLLCGGFVFAIRLNHTMCDASGIIQFMIALGEIARGASTPSTLPVWQRDLLFARDPPRVTCSHHAFDDVITNTSTNNNIITQDDMAYKTFFFGSAKISAIRRLLVGYPKKFSTLDMLTACIWRCRTIALQPDPKDDMRMIFGVNARTNIKSFIPIGYYGNAFVHAAAISTAEELSNKPLSHALDLVVKAKLEVNEEYVRSQADLMVIKDRPYCTIVRSYAVSDVTRAKMDTVDFGWGPAAYGGPIIGAFDFFSFYLSSTNINGEQGIMVPICLTSAVMEKFTKELNSILAQDNNDNDQETPK